MFVCTLVLSRVLLQDWFLCEILLGVELDVKRSKFVCVCACVHVHVCLRLYVFVYVCVCVCAFVFFVFVCIRVCVCGLCSDVWEGRLRDRLEDRRRTRQGQTNTHMCARGRLI